MTDSGFLSDPTAYADRLLVGRLTRLRPLLDDDLPLLARWWNEPQWMVLQQGRVVPGDARATEEMFRKWSANNDESGVGYSIVNGDGDLVGHLTLWGITPTVRIATYAIIIGSPYVGRGYGSDATRVALRLAFDELGVNKVELRVWSFNERARHVYAKVGFVEEGRRRAAVHHGSTFGDEILMGMLRHEYESLGVGHG